MKISHGLPLYGCSTTFKLRLKQKGQFNTFETIGILSIVKKT